MTATTRIAWVGEPDSPLPDLLHGLLDRPVVRRCDELRAHVADIVTFAPQVLLVASAEPDLRLIGALELLAALIPGVRLVVVAPRSREVQTRPLAQSLGAAFLATPIERTELAVLLAAQRSEGSSNALSTLHEFLRGLSDEVNNPLQFVQGNLQLLAADLEATKDSARLAQIQAMREGITRIGATMDRIRILARAGTPRRLTHAIPVRPLVDEAVRLVQQQSGVTFVVAEPAATPIQVLGDVELMRAVLLHLLRVGAELAAGTAPRIDVTSDAGRVTIALSLEHASALDWQLPRTFAPYYLTKVLKASPHGLNLFLVQTIVLGLGGEATARRVDERGLRFELSLPAP